VEVLKKMPVVGLDFGNLFDIAPRVTIVIGKVLQMQQPADSKKPLTWGAPITAISADTMVALTASIELLQIRGNTPSGHQEVLTDPTYHIINFHISGTVWGQGFGKERASQVR